MKCQGGAHHFTTDPAVGGKDITDGTGNGLVVSIAVFGANTILREMSNPPSLTAPPLDLQLIGHEIALRWPDATEDFLPGEFLRACSPSAENMGERDIFGKQYGGTGPKNFAGVTVVSWKYIGNYAVAFTFSDGHNTGIYTWKYLRALGEEVRAGGPATGPT